MKSFEGRQEFDLRKVDIARTDSDVDSFTMIVFQGLKTNDVEGL
jgi:hypothetical protein